MPISGFAALQALRDVGQVQAGQEVLVIGAAGGVGSFAVQLAKAFGAQVTGVCAPPPRSTWSTRSAPTAWSTTPARMSPTGSRHWDLIVDIAGHRSLSQLRRALAPKGDAGDRRQ